MAYIKTDWIDNETVVSENLMDKIETELENLDINKSNIDHNHDSVYAALVHAHPEYAEIINTYTKGEINAQYAAFIDELNSNTANIDLLDDLLDQLLGGYTGTTVIIDNLLSTSAGAALSANMGRELKSIIDNNISSIFKYKGSVATYASLPSSDQTIGDVWNVLDTEDNYAWSGSEWDLLGGITPLATSDNNGLMSSIDYTKLSGVENNANNYVHPVNHPASIITQDTNNRFVSDLEKTNWNTAYSHSQSSHARIDSAKVFVSATAPTTGVQAGDIWITP